MRFRTLTGTTGSSHGTRHSVPIPRSTRDAAEGYDGVVHQAGRIRTFDLPRPRRALWAKLSYYL